jgi:hypothetical protein
VSWHRIEVCHDVGARSLYIIQNLYEKLRELVLLAQQPTCAGQTVTSVMCLCETVVRQCVDHALPGSVLSISLCLADSAQAQIRT